jgi:hypothetical protein
MHNLSKMTPHQGILSEIGCRIVVLSRHWATPPAGQGGLVLLPEGGIAMLPL